jgi:hypothetical protein
MLENNMPFRGTWFVLLRKTTIMNTEHKNPSHDPKEEGKVKPIRMTKEELEKRKESGYSTDEASQKNPREKNGESGFKENENKEQSDYNQ